MVRSSPRNNAAIASLVEEIDSKHQLNSQTYLILTGALLSGQRLSSEERQQIIRVLDYLKLGRIQLMD
ncbi:MAG: hypothetical protein VKJ24_16610 [Synechococcales bacterium]|nr:hypothetical protein [Synechococcales bacterium]